MKIVKEGKWEHPFTCTGCKSELVAEANDVQYTNYGDDGSVFYVQCPQCGTRHEFKNGWSTLPPNVVNSATRKR